MAQIMSPQKQSNAGTLSTLGSLGGGLVGGIFGGPVGAAVGSTAGGMLGGEAGKVNQGSGGISNAKSDVPIPQAGEVPTAAVPDQPVNTQDAMQRRLQTYQQVRANSMS